jgi:hypothetical protein
MRLRDMLAVALHKWAGHGVAGLPVDRWLAPRVDLITLRML